MNAQGLNRATSIARDRVSDAAYKLFDISEEFAERCRDGYRDAERGVRRLKIAAEQGADDTRRRIRAHPLATLSLVAASAFFLGGLVGRRKRRHGWR